MPSILTLQIQLMHPVTAPIRSHTPRMYKIHEWESEFSRTIVVNAICGPDSKSSPVLRFRSDQIASCRSRRRVGEGEVQRRRAPDREVIIRRVIRGINMQLRTSRLRQSARSTGIGSDQIGWP